MKIQKKGLRTIKAREIWELKVFEDNLGGDLRNRKDDNDNNYDNYDK